MLAIFIFLIYIFHCTDCIKGGDMSALSAYLVPKVAEYISVKFGMQGWGYRKVIELM